MLAITGTFQPNITFIYHKCTTLTSTFSCIKEDIKASSGALDLGGASTQITFVPQNKSLATKHFKLYGKDYPVYTKSYLCYGLTEIYRRFLAQLAKVRKTWNTVLKILVLWKKMLHDGFLR